MRQQARGKVERDRLVEVEPDRRLVAFAVDAELAVELPDRHADYVHGLDVAVDRAAIDTTVSRELDGAHAAWGVIELVLDLPEPRRFRLGARFLHTIRRRTRALPLPRGSGWTRSQ